MSKRVIISRESARGSVRDMLLEHKHAVDSRLVASGLPMPPHIAVITADGLGGKTTFLLHDVKSLMVKRTPFANPSASELSSHAWVYINCDIESSPFC